MKSNANFLTILLLPKSGSRLFHIFKIYSWRCVVTTIDPDTGIRRRNNQPLKVLKE